MQAQPDDRFNERFDDMFLTMADEAMPAARYHLQLGDRLFEEYRQRHTQPALKGALLHYRRAVESDPSLADAYVGLARAMWAQGEADAPTAAQYCRMALNYDANNVSAHREASRFFAKAGMWADALKHSQHVVARAPWHAVGDHWQRVRAQASQLNTLPFAMASGIKLAAMAPLSLAHGLWQACQPKRKPAQKPVTVWIQTLGPVPADGTHPLLAAQEPPAEPAGRGSMLDSVADPVQRLENTLELVQNHLEARRFFEALYLLRGAKEQHPDNPYLFSNSAYVLFKLEDYEGAIAEYNQALELGDDDAWKSTIAQTLGMIHAKLRNEPEKARELFSLACSLDPDNNEVLTMFGEAQLDSCDVDGAIATYRELVSREPGNGGYHTYLGYLYWIAGRMDEAISAYQTALLLTPDDAITHNNLGVIYLDDCDDAARALPLFAKAYALKPDYTLACFNLGRCHRMLGQLDDAMACYRSALELNASNPEVADDELQSHLNNLFSV